MGTCCLAILGFGLVSLEAPFNITSVWKTCFFPRVKMTLFKKKVGTNKKPAFSQGPFKKENDVTKSPPKFNSSPPKSYQNPKGKDCLPTEIFQGRTVKLQGSNLFKEKHTHTHTHTLATCRHHLVVTPAAKICAKSGQRPAGSMSWSRDLLWKQANHEKKTLVV